MKRALGLLFILGAWTFVACQQTQEADDDANGTTVIEKETTVLPADDQADTQVDVEMKGGEDGAAGEVDVESGGTEN